MQKNRKMILIGVFILLVLILIGEQLYIEKVIKTCATYDSFVLAEKQTINFEKEWFEKQWGISTDFVEKKYSSTKKLVSILERKIKLYSSATIICIQVPPNAVEYPEFEEVINSHPEITFYTYCTVQPISYWDALTNQERIEMENQYNATSEMLIGHKNVVHFEFYNLEWMIGNQGNYLKKMSFNEEVSLAFFHSFIDHLNLYIGPSHSFSGGKISFENIYKDKLKEKTAIVLGDSIWDIDRTSTGVSSVIEELSGLKIENLAVGGTSAAFRENVPDNFTKIVNDLVLREEKSNPDYIFVEFGLNDYFSQVSIENKDDLFDIASFKGALRAGIEALKNNFEEAEIILIGPTTIMLCDFGNVNINGEGSLRDYEHALEDIGKEYDISIIYNYMVQDLYASEIPKNLRADQVHFNERGMYTYGKQVLNYLLK